MRRRILFAILGTVVLAVALAGTGTYLLVRRQAVHTAEADLRREAESLAGLLGAARQLRGGQISQRRVVAGLRLEGISVLVKGPAGRVNGELPDGVTAEDVPPESMVADTTTSGRRGDLTWAAAHVPGVGGSVVSVVITRKAEPPRPPLGWFLVGSGLALAVGAAVAAWLSDGLTRPLRRAQEATLRLASGDLATRLPDPAPGDADEVADLTRSINHLATELEQSRGAEHRFLMSISHELRTPLTSIQGYAEAISDGTAPDPGAAARVVGSEAQRLGRLVGDLLDLARLDAREFALHLRPVPAAEVVTETAEGMRPTADAAGISLTVRDAGRHVVSLVDPDRLAQCVGNLVENAVRHAASSVWVDTHLHHDGSVSVHVTDDGPGVAPEDLPRVFDRLFTRTGTGLGLAIVRQLVEGMGGTVRAVSPALDDGRGARFELSVPPAPRDGGAADGVS